MKKFKFATILCISIFVSCKALYSNANGTNKAISFNSKTKYTSYFTTRFNINSQNIFFPEPNAYWETVAYILKDVDYFYGITLNDSLQIDDPYLNEIKSCSGRISDIINALDKDYKTKPTQLAKFSLMNSNGIKMDISKGKSVIFVLSTKLGNERLRTIKELSAEIEALNNPNVNYYLITVDDPASYGAN